MGRVQVTAEKQQTIPLPPLIGALALGGGLVLLPVGSRRLRLWALILLPPGSRQLT